MKICKSCGCKNDYSAIKCRVCHTEFDFSPIMIQTNPEIEDNEHVSKGTMIADRYQVIKYLGQGGMGTVYLVCDTLMNEEVSLKILHPNLAENPNSLLKFIEEVKISRSLSHDNIIRVHEYSVWSGIHFFSMEYFAGQTLRDYINNKKNRKECYDVDYAYSIIINTLSALDYAHQTTIHRDIKPENIMISDKKSYTMVKILDFGIAKALTPSQYYKFSFAAGTPYYIAPEQRETQEIDRRADLFSVGMVLYELLTGNVAGYNSPRPSEINTSLTKDIDEVINISLSSSPDARFQSAKEFKERLSEVLDKNNYTEISERPKEPTMFSQLFVEVEPSDSIINIERLDEEINENFYQGIELKPGLYHIAASLSGYKSEQQLIKVNEDEDYICKFRLVKKDPEYKNGEVWVSPTAGVEFVWVSGGTYEMGGGSWQKDVAMHEKPVHEVCLDGFWIGKYVVTKGQWAKIMEDLPYIYYMGSTIFGDKQVGENIPLIDVSWNDIKKFIEKLNQLENTNNYRLPTEAEWEYACRSGGRQEIYSGSSNIDDVGWYRKKSLSKILSSKINPIGMKQPNSIGLYDMSGNVWEFCEDVYEMDAYNKHNKYNPIHIWDDDSFENDTERVLRGGSFMEPASYCRSTSRIGQSQTNGRFNIGFRLVKMN